VYGCWTFAARVLNAAQQTYFVIANAMYMDVQVPREAWMPGAASEAIFQIHNQSVGDCFVTSFLAMTGRPDTA